MWTGRRRDMRELALPLTARCWRGSDLKAVSRSRPRTFLPDLLSSISLVFPYPMTSEQALPEAGPSKCVSFLRRQGGRGLAGLRSNRRSSLG